MTGISYEEAVSTLTAMFSETWNQQQLETVLRHFEGHMENTVDTILSHGDGDPDALIARLSNKADVSMDEEIARRMSESQNTRPSTTQQQSSSSFYPGSNFVRSPTPATPTPAPTRPNPTPKKKGIGTPTDLPPDFLRIPGQKYDSTISEDEALARMLQDELFTAEIANNPEFAHLARGRLPTASHASSLGGSSSTAPMGPNIMDQISSLGNQAKMKLNELANQWNARQNNSNSAGQGRQETRGLLDDREDDDDIAFAGGGRNTVMEMSSFPSAGGSKKDK